jgi:hypothetical protein
VAFCCATNNQKGVGVDDRWPYPISQAMQRQTGSRIKPVPVPETPPTAPASSNGEASAQAHNSAEASRSYDVERHSKG